MRRRTRSLDGAGWWIRAHPGTEAALAAAARWAGPAAGAIHAVHEPDPGEGWIAAHVPGSVLDDLMRAGEVPDVYRERNSLLAEWVPERAWTYRTTFEVEPPGDGAPQRTWLRFHGIDHAGHVFVDGRHVGSHAGMFVPFEIELPAEVARAGSHALAVVVEPAPGSEPQVGRTSKVAIHKARMSYGWDFCPRLVHQGLWQSVEVVTAGSVRIRDVWARPVLADDLRSATVTVQVVLDRAGGATDELDIDAQLHGVRAHAALAAGGDIAELRLRIDHPELWWPNGMGAPALHDLDVRVSARGALVDERRVAVGFRRIEPVEEPEGAGRSWSSTVNGRPLEVLGWNWTPLDALYGVPRPDRLDHLLRLVVASGANLLRVWGGGLIETEAFYDACDRLGILVWQEFSQSSSGIDDEPSADPAFVDLMRHEAEAIVPLRRNHPSLAIWCGGNELQDAGGPLEDGRSPVLAALHEVVARLDPERIWLPTSPSGPRFGNRLADIEADPDGLHDVHGPWEHQGLRDHNLLWDSGTSRFNGEFGVEGMTNRRVHQSLIAAERRWPADRTNPVYRHLGDWWINAPLVQEAFGGRIDDLETLRRASQHLQADGLRYAVEANRRRWPHNRGSIPWQLNESFPNAWCTAVVDHGGDPKPAFHAVARAYAPAVVCARFRAWALDGARTLEIEPFAWAADRAGPATIACRTRAADGSLLDERTVVIRLGGREPQSGGPIELGLGAPADGLVVLDLELETDGGVAASNRYLLARGADFGPIRRLAEATVEVAVDRGDDTWCVQLAHRGGPAALGIRITDARPAGASGWAEPVDDGFDLLPGESRALAVRWPGVAAADRRLHVDAWNVAPTEVA
ncbi:MAG TPA: glycoside hydrolase family 2 TIM barrel-domain containing protein [Candidatus Limnocylindrales bacterium]|nr:glycoside hydrolase family 2 TIM barrel-domain containing protein [Candidatus Limnocylindrales bacterium]